jgi:prepilin-type N-terminal cleavage/methylation domain-containing protein/prepilin-type processing-associated H-X9-DG protein
MIHRYNRNREVALAGFTLIEMLCSVTIIAILLAMGSPLLAKMLNKAESTVCTSNLRQLWQAVELASQDNDNRFPIIEPMPANPIYEPEMAAKPLAEVLAEYGINDIVLSCPADRKAGDRFSQMGASYEWRPLVDDENVMAPQLFTRRGVRMANLSRLRLLMDFDPVHGGKHNMIYADGHIRMR